MDILERFAETLGEEEREILTHLREFLEFPFDDVTFFILAKEWRQTQLNRSFEMGPRSWMYTWILDLPPDFA
jgi:hypothetical protein